MYLPMSAAALSPGQLTLADAIELTIRNNPQVQRQAAITRQHEARVTEAQGAFDWQLNAGTAAVRRSYPVTTGGVVTNDSHEDTVYESRASLSKRFENGILFEPGVLLVNSQPDDASEGLGQDDSTLTFNAAVPLLRGAGSDVVTADVAAARARSKVAQLHGERARQEMLRDTTVAYWRCLGARHKQQIFDNTEERQRQFLQVLRQLVDSGEVPLGRWQRASAELGLLQISRDRAFGDADRTCRSLQTRMGSDVPGNLTETLPTVADPARLAPQATYSDMALQRRPDIQAQKLAIEAERTLLTAVQNESEPRLDLNLRPDRVGLDFQMPLGGRTAQGRIESQVARIDERESALHIAREAVLEEIAQSLSRLRQQAPAWQLATESAGLLQQLVDEARRQVRLGEGNLDRLFNLEDKLTQAQTGALEAQVAYAVALAELAGALGIDAPTEDSGNARQLATLFSSLPR